MTTSSLRVLKNSTVKLGVLRGRHQERSASTIRCGCPPSAVIQKFPDDSIQSLVSPDPSWWVSVTGQTLTRGGLVWAIVPYPEQKPFRLVPVGRGQDARQHTQAQYRLEEFRVGETPRQTSSLPVAGLPLRGGEEYLVRRGKRRPCLILASTDVRVGCLPGAREEAMANGPDSPCRALLQRKRNYLQGGMAPRTGRPDPSM